MMPRNHTRWLLSISATFALLLTTTMALPQQGPAAKGVSVRGHVTRLPGAEANLKVDLLGPGRGIGPDTGIAVGPDGAFEFTNVPPGNYSVRLSALVPVQPITVGNQDVTGIEFSVPRVRTIAGQILIEGLAAAEASGQRLSFNIVYPNGSVAVAAIVQPDGRFSVLMPEGDHRIALSAPPGYTTRAMTFGSIDLLKDPLSLKAADTQRLNVTLAKTGPGIPGTPPPRPATVTQPVLLSQVQPEYTDAARQARVMGRVTLRGIVDTSGLLTNLQVVEGLGYGLDENAIAAALKWHFRPGTSDGVPVPTTIVVMVSFSLK